MSDLVANQDKLLATLAEVPVGVGEWCEVTLAAARELTAAQISAIGGYLAQYGITLSGVRQAAQRVSSAVDEYAAPAPTAGEMGDYQVSIAGAPSVAMSAATVVGYVLRSAALAGASLVALLWTTKSDTVAADTTSVIDSTRWPLLLILLILVAAYLILRRLL